MGKELWTYIDNFAGQLSPLPVVNSKPEVLIIGEGYQTGAPMQNVAELNLSQVLQ